MSVPMAEEMIEQRILRGGMNRMQWCWNHEYADLCVDYDRTEQYCNLTGVICDLVCEI